MREPLNSSFKIHSANKGFCDKMSSPFQKINVTSIIIILDKIILKSVTSQVTCAVILIRNSRILC